jgi:putative DNA primase/helicase
MGTEPYSGAPPTRHSDISRLLQHITELRLRYLRCGYIPLACCGKAPVLPNWQSAHITADQIQAWTVLYPNALNTGIRTTHHPAADIDVLDAPLVETFERALLKYLPHDRTILRRIGRAPKRLIPFTCSAPFKKCQVIFRTTDGASHRVEILSSEHQFIAEGWHPDTGAPYTWIGDKLGDVPPAVLPTLDEATAHRFLADIRAFIAAKGWTELKAGNGAREQARHNNGQARGSAYARAALEQECDAVATTPRGCRNDTLNRAAFNLFQLVAAGELNRNEVIAQLTAAADKCGLITDDGEKAVAATIASGARAGERHPRRAPDDGESASESEARAGNETKAEPEAEAAASSASDSGTAPPPPSGRHVALTHASAIVQRPVEWLWRPRLARGKIALIAGDPGVGKSSLLADIVARISAGTLWPDSGTAPGGRCIILSAEDAADDTTCPRLEIAGADMSQVFIMRMAGGGRRQTFSLATDLPLLADALTRLGDVALIAIDPITAYLGDKIDTHQTAAVRGVLEPLDAFAADCRLAILGVTHPPKAQQTKAINAFTGSLAFIAAARTAFVALEEPDSDSDRRLLLAVKSNIGPLAQGIAYRLTTTQTAAGIETVKVTWDGEPVDIAANEALREAAEDQKHSGQQKREAENFLTGYLAAGPMPADKVTEAAEANGISQRTLKRAKQTLRIVSEKDRFAGPWMWRLPR